MARSNIKAVFENDVQTVWNVITDVKNYIWRTDLSKTEIISDKQFIHCGNLQKSWINLMNWPLNYGIPITTRLVCLQC